MLTINQHTGEWITYYKGGSIETKGRYLKGKRIGKWIWYHDNGSIWIEGTYDDNKLVGLWLFYDRGEIIKSEFYAR